MRQIVSVVTGFVIVCILFLGLNFRQLYVIRAIRSETKRLTDLAMNTPDEFRNPEPVEDHFTGGVSPAFWKFFTINGGGKVLNADAWHAVSVTYKQELIIQHHPDADFDHENANLFNKPAAEQYNNASFISRDNFRPTPSTDVVLKFSVKVGDSFYGTSGVIFQPMGTLQKDGMIVKPFDMFGLSIVGKESLVQGVNGSLCYLALSSVPVEVDAFSADARDWHDYEIRLRWLSKTEWLGTVKMDDASVCQMSMPAFGPVEVHVWSDNVLAMYQPPRWWEIGPFLNLKFQNSGEKQFCVRTIQISTEDRWNGVSILVK